MAASGSPPGWPLTIAAQIRKFLRFARDPDPVAVLHSLRGHGVSGRPSGAISPRLAGRWETVIRPPPGQAARTELRNLSTSSFSRLLSWDSDCAAECTCDE